MKVSTILSTKRTGVITTGPKQTIREAAALLTKHNIGVLVVVDAGELVGIISERDIVRQVVKSDNFFTLTVGDVMTREVVTALPQDDIMSVAHLMTEKRFRHLPILEGDKLIGMVSIGDVLKIQRDHYRGEIDTLETQILAES